jgi:hypothetical protein
MGELKKKPAPLGSRQENAAVIAKYESMSGKAIDEELRAKGIDATPTVAAITAMVRAKIAEWQGFIPAINKRR